MHERVLVVDDSKPICQFLSQSILKPKNFEVIIADDGIKGLELALTASPDLIITDNQMPGMTGLELLSALKQRGVGIPAILMTAHGSEQIAVEAFRLGIRDYVIKPFEPEDMHQAIESALREARLEKERDDLLQKLTDSNAQLQRRLQEINTLYGIGKSVSSSLDIEEVLRRVVDAAVYVTGAEEGSLLLLDEQQGELYVRASKNMESATKSMRLRVDDSLAGQVLRTKKPLVIDDDDRWQKIKTAYLVKSLIYVPLISEGKAIGVLGVSNRRKTASFERRDTRVLAMLADYASIAIRNADHYSRTETERTKLSAILSQSMDPILVLDSEGKVILANNAAMHTLNLPGDNRIYEQPISTFVQDVETIAFLQQMSGEGWSPHTEIKAPDGRIFNASMSLIAGTGRTIVMHDITQLKELDRLKSEFVSVVSYDLRGPLTSILSYLQLISNAGDINSTQQNYINHINENVSDITALINDLLDLGRLETGIDMNVGICSVEEILNEVISKQREASVEKGIEMTFDLETEGSQVLGDRRRLWQAFNHIFENAVKFTKSGGTIAVESRRQEGQLIIKITDSGIGISPADQAYIFDKFYRSSSLGEDYEGSGLGLSIVRSVIEKHQGRVWVNSEIGVGSTFSIVLPVISVPAL